MTDIIPTPEATPLTTQTTRDRISVANAIRLWLSQFPSPNTREAYRRDLERFAEFTRGPDTITSMTSFLALDEYQAHTILDAYRVDMLQRTPPLQPATVNRRLSTVGSFVSSARRHGLTTLRIEAKMVESRAYRDTRGPGTAGVQKLIEAAKAQRNPWKAARDEAIMRLLFSLGLRRDELVSCDLEHLDLAAATLSIKGKGQIERRTLSVPPAALAAVEAWLQHRGDKPGALIYGIDSKARMSGSALYQMIVGLGKQAGVRARPHGIRHAAITAVLDATNGDVRRAQAFGRHASASTTLLYDDNRQDLGGSAARIVDALVE